MAVVCGAGGAAATTPDSPAPRSRDQVCGWVPGPRERGSGYLLCQEQ